MRSFEVKPSLKKTLKKLYKKNRKLYDQVMKKIDEVVNSYDLSHYKNLRYDFSDSKRAHVGHFVLIFSYDQKKDVVSFEMFDHHNKIYRR